MKIKDKLIKIFLVFSLASVAINLSSITMNNAIIHPNLENEVPTCVGPIKVHPEPSVLGGSTAHNKVSNPFNFLFQVMFILFSISPPIMALMLFLIWKELKEKNRMK